MTFQVKAGKANVNVHEDLVPIAVKELPKAKEVDLQKMTIFIPEERRTLEVLQVQKGM